MATYVTHPPRKLQSQSYSGPITLSNYERFQRIVKEWVAGAKHPRFKRPYTELMYQPMLEVMKYLREIFRAGAPRGPGSPPVFPAAQETHAPAITLAADSGFGGLNGRWLRPDGGYVLARACGPPRLIWQYSKENVRTLAIQITTDEERSENALALAGWSVTTPIISASSAATLRT